MTFVYKKYDKNYDVIFDSMKKQILANVSHKIVIEHIGSTAVANLGGKGIIDISIGIKKWSEAEEILKALKKIGFRHFHDIENHNLFVSTKEKCEEGDFHIHISRIDTKRYRQTIAFRNFLIAHPSEALRYDRLKEELFKKCRGNRQSYKELKKEYFVDLAHRHPNYLSS